MKYKIINFFSNSKQVSQDWFFFQITYTTYCSDKYDNQKQLRKERVYLAYISQPQTIALRSQGSNSLVSRRRDGGDMGLTGLLLGSWSATFLYIIPPLPTPKEPLSIEDWTSLQQPTIKKTPQRHTQCDGGISSIEDFFHGNFTSNWQKLAHSITEQSVP